MCAPEAWTNQLGYHLGKHSLLQAGTLKHHTIWFLLEPMKGLVLWNHSRRIQGKSRISESFGRGPVLMVYQKPEALNLTNDILHNEHLQVKLYGQKSRLHKTQQLPVPLR